MRPSDLLFLVIALIYIPQERSCLIIYFSRWSGSPTDKKDCHSEVTGFMAMTLFSGESLTKLPNHLALQMRCPRTRRFNVDAELLGPQDLSWMLVDAIPVMSCASTEEKSNVALSCYRLLDNHHVISFELQQIFEAVGRCRIRIFLADVATVQGKKTITNDHRMQYSSDQIPVTRFSESRYFNKWSYELCYAQYDDYFWIPRWAHSVNSVSASWSGTDILLMVCGVAMASAVVSS